MADARRPPDADRAEDSESGLPGPDGAAYDPVAAAVHAASVGTDQDTGPAAADLSESAEEQTEAVAPAEANSPDVPEPAVTAAVEQAEDEKAGDEEAAVEKAEDERAEDEDAAVEEAGDEEVAVEKAEDEDAEVEPSELGIGHHLRAARQARGLSPEDLARTLNLQVRVIIALEADDHDALPGPAFVRGYIRSYARLVGAPGEQLLAAFDERTGGVAAVVRPSPQLDSAQGGTALVHRRPGLVMVLTTLALIAAAAAVLALLWPDAAERLVQDAGTETAAGTQTPRAVSAPALEQGARAPAAGGVPTIEPLIEPIAGFVIAGAEPEALGSSAAGTPGTRAAEAGAAGSADDLADADADAVNVVDAPDAASAAAVAMVDGFRRERSVDGLLLTVHAGGEEHLQFEFSADCWIEVLDRNDVNVYADLSRSGQSVEIWGRAPFRITIGYAPAVELSYNGARVALRPHTRNDVASLVIGR